MHKPTAIFFGSFLHHSAKVLEILHQSDQIYLLGVITTPPKPAGRKQKLQKTHVHLYAETHNLPVATPDTLKNLSPMEVIGIWDLSADRRGLKFEIPPDLFIVAGYGKLLPPEWLQFPQIAPLNIHFSLLPKYRGAMPGEWAILMGETTTGNTIIEMSPKFDTGHIIAQQSVSINPIDTRESLYTKLYPLGAQLLLVTLPHYLNWKITSSLDQLDQLGQFKLFLPPHPQPESSQPYARLVTKDETYIPWDLIQKALQGKSLSSHDKLTSLLDQTLKYSIPYTSYSILIHNAIRAFSGWPGIWTEVNTFNGNKRLKLLSSHLHNHQLILDQVQLEGKQPQNFIDLNLE